MALTAFLCKITGTGQSPVFSIIKIGLELVEFYEVLLHLIAICYVYHSEKYDKDDESYIVAEHLSRKNITTKYLPQRKIAGVWALVLTGLLMDSFL